MSDVRVTYAHRTEAEESFGGTARELAEDELACEDHTPGYYERGQNVGRACKECGEVLSEDWIPHDELPKDYDTFNLDRVEQQRQRDLEREREFYDGRIEQKAEEIAKDEIHQEARELTPSQDASAAEWKEAFQKVDSDDAWQMIKRSHEKSEAWDERKQAKRDAADDSLTCEAQLLGCSGDYDHMHHKSYQHLGCEPLWDLVPVCHHCHDVLHDKKEPETEPEKEPAAVSYEDFFGEPAVNGEDSTELPF